MRTLSRRALNRATLARQLLLSRAELSPLAAVEHLAGLQAQTPHTWYVGLWSRIAGVRTADIAALLTSRAAVRIALMRSTVHFVSAADALALRPLVQPVLDRDLFGNSLHGRWMTGLDVAAVAAAGREVLADRPLTPAELGTALLERFPENNAAALAYAVRNLLPVVQTPPRGVWGRSGRTMHAPLEQWVGAPLREMTPAGMVRRYLTAYGPATVRDVQTWCGLTRLGEVVDGMDLVRYADGYVDLPDAPRPDPDTRAPVRYLYDFDNLLLSHQDRSRFVTDDFRARAVTQHGPVPRPVLIDGVTAGAWTIDKAVLTVRMFVPLTAADRDALTAEGLDLIAFHGPRGAPDVRIVPSGAGSRSPARSAGSASRGDRAAAAGSG
jgi:hypothetical protein